MILRSLQHVRHGEEFFDLTAGALRLIEKFEVLLHVGRNQACGCERDKENEDGAGDSDATGDQRTVPVQKDGRSGGSDVQGHHAMHGVAQAFVLPIVRRQKSLFLHRIPSSCCGCARYAKKVNGLSRITRFA